MGVVTPWTVLILYKADFLFTAICIMRFFSLRCLDTCCGIHILTTKLFSTLPTP